MSDLKARLERIEDKAGLAEEKSYIFIHIIRPQTFLSKAERKIFGDVYCQKDDFEGIVVICEGQKGTFRGIDFDSEEGKNILLEHGYRILNNDG